jgi:3-(3-hydroxy-phenyl)propionate hydroxylase
MSMAMDAGNPVYDVAIVGFGPTGAVAAGLLGGQGISTFVCDRLHDVYDKPRAIALDHEIMRVFQQLGVVEQVEPFMEPFTNSEYYGMDGQLIKCMSTVAPPYPLGFNPSIVFTQPPVERVLREHVAHLPSVKVSLGQTLVQVLQDDDLVTLTLRGEDGVESTVKARYFVACDGASSTVRGQVGITLEDLGFDEPWLVVDVMVNDQGLARLPKVSVQYCEPQRPCTYIIGPGNHRRWEISINPGEDPLQVATPEGSWKLLSRWLSPDEATLWRQASYRFHALVARDWRMGRVFVAGDAAHQQPPFLGQGMCQGVRDVANLCWKLGAVLKGQAGDDLLDTYGAERKGHVTELTTRIKAIGQIVGERDVARARSRDARLLAECDGVVKPVPRQNVQPALAHGLLATQEHPARGTLFPQAWIKHQGARCRMDDVLGTGWQLILGPQADAVHQNASKSTAVKGLGIHQLGSAGLEETDGVLMNWFALNDCSAVIVRPDHYIYGVAKTASELASQLNDLNRI